MLSTKDLAWAAGFLEGEGSFSFSSGIRVSAVQVQREPLERLLAMFGGSINVRDRKLSHGVSTKQPLHVWQLFGNPAAGVTMTLLCMLSPRRLAQATAALAKWKAGPGTGSGNRQKTHCPKGHEYTPENTALYKPTRGIVGRGCIECRRTASREYARRQREAA